MGCTLKGSRFKGSRFIVSPVSFSLHFGDGFSSGGRYKISQGRFDPHKCTPKNGDTMSI